MLGIVTYRNVEGGRGRRFVTPTPSFFVPNSIEIQRVTDPEYFSNLRIKVTHLSDPDLVQVEICQSTRSLLVASLGYGERIALLGHRITEDTRAGVFIRHGIMPRHHHGQVDIANFIYDHT